MHVYITRTLDIIVQIFCTCRVCQIVTRIRRFNDFYSTIEQIKWSAACRLKPFNLAKLLVIFTGFFTAKYWPPSSDLLPIIRCCQYFTSASASNWSLFETRAVVYFPAWWHHWFCMSHVFSNNIYSIFHIVGGKSLTELIKQQFQSNHQSSDRSDNILIFLSVWFDCLVS